jgi:hypothetical protein
VINGIDACFVFLFVRLLADARYGVEFIFWTNEFSHRSTFALTNVSQPHSETRLRVKFQSDERVSYSGSSSSTTTTKDPEHIPKTARVIEQMLFRQAKSLSDFTDRSTLDSRIRVLMTILLQRRMCKGSQRNRAQILQQLMGRPRYQQAAHLLQEIRQAKNARVAQLRCQQFCVAGFDHTIPGPVRNLFFQTNLMSAFEKYPVQRLDRVDWRELIEQAEENLRVYKDYAREEGVEV